MANILKFIVSQGKHYNILKAFKYKYFIIIVFFKIYSDFFLTSLYLVYYYKRGNKMKMRVPLNEKLNYIKGQKNKTKGGEVGVSISLFCYIIVFL